MRAAFTTLAALMWLAAPAAAQHAATAEAEDSWAVGTLEVLEEGSEEWRPVGATSEPGAMGCKINIRASNGGSRLISVFRDSNTQVRTKVGWWKRIWPVGGATTFELRPGGTLSTVADLDMSCSANRRYRFLIYQYSTAERTYGIPLEISGKYTYYYPSSDQFTTTVDVKLGDLNRFFR